MILSMLAMLYCDVRCICVLVAILYEDYSWIGKLPFRAAQFILPIYVVKYYPVNFN